MRNPDMHEALTRFGTDVNGLAQLVEVIFEEKAELARASLQDEEWDEDENALKIEAEPHVTYDELLSLILRLRGGHTAKVTDIVEMREYVTRNMQALERRIN